MQKLPIWVTVGFGAIVGMTLGLLMDINSHLANIEKLLQAMGKN